MTIATLQAALIPAMRDMVGTDWTVSSSDDAWSALELLGNAPGRVRAVLLIEDFRAEENSPRGLYGHLSGRLIVQVNKGMAQGSSGPQLTLYEAEEKARRTLLAIVFQKAGDAAWPDALPDGQPPHEEVGYFYHTGSGPYKAPNPEIGLTHPAREVRWSLPMVLRQAAAVRRVNLPAES